MVAVWGLAYGGVSVSTQTWLMAAAPKAREAASALFVAVWGFRMYAAEHDRGAFALAALFTFVGVILVPIIGNAAEHATAVVMALKDKMDVTLNICVSSSTQIAFFIAPLVVVRRRSDGQKGSLEFQGWPRFYFNFEPHRP